MQGVLSFVSSVTTLASWGLSSKVAAVLQAAVVYCMREKINLRVSHVARTRNDWADKLSRGCAAEPDFWRKFSNDLRGSVDGQHRLRSGPAKEPGFGRQEPAIGAACVHRRFDCGQAHHTLHRPSSALKFGMYLNMCV